MFALNDISLTWIVLPFFIGGILYPRVVKHKTGNVVRDQVKNLQIMITMTGVIMVVLWLSLPSTPSLSTFGYPDSIENINSQEKLLNLLQDYNRALVRTTEVVHWLIFIGMFWILMSVWQLLKVYRDKLDLEIAEKRRDESNS